MAQMETGRHYQLNNPASKSSTGESSHTSIDLTVFFMISSSEFSVAV